ncbi:putative chromosome-partitioning protein ParB [Anaerolineae bacterium]|nr:putative chromosome-partitioning protein ParB [Anaerolineae bacterium]
MITTNDIRDIPLDDLVIGKGQVRVKDVHKDIDELAESIRVQGLLQPIVVCEGEKKGKFEILTGQRRFLAHKKNKAKTIRALVLNKPVDAETAKAISVTENLVRRDVSQKEYIDACTALYKKYGSIKAVAEATGLKAQTVSQYVKYDRLIKPLKGMVDSGEVDIRVALRAQDAAAAGGEKPDPADAVKLAKEMASMPGIQQKKLVQEREEKPEASVDESIEAARTGSKVTQIVVTLTGETHRHLQTFADNEGTSQDDAAASLIEEGLLGKGFGS